MVLSLGKKPATQDRRDLRLSLLEPATTLRVPPNRFGCGTRITDWGMLGNDRYGDCVWAGAAHETMLWTRTAGHPAAFDDHGVLAAYSAVTGFKPADPATDQGTDVRQALRYRRDTGLLDTAGIEHRIGAYVALTPGSWAELVQACFYFLSVGIGFEFPASAMDQFNQGKAWDVVPGARVDGGHYVPVIGRVNADTVSVVTWGRRQLMTRAFFEKYCDEAWALVSPDELRKGVNRRGLNLAGLIAALQQIHV